MGAQRSSSDTGERVKERAGAHAVIKGAITCAMLGALGIPCAAGSVEGQAGTAVRLRPTASIRAQGPSSLSGTGGASRSDLPPGRMFGVPASGTGAVGALGVSRRTNTVRIWKLDVPVELVALGEMLFREEGFAGFSDADGVRRVSVGFTTSPGFGLDVRIKLPR